MIEIAFKPIVVAIYDARLVFLFYKKTINERFQRWRPVVNVLDPTAVSWFPNKRKAREIFKITFYPVKCKMVRNTFDGDLSDNLLILLNQLAETPLLHSVRVNPFLTRIKQV